MPDQNQRNIVAICGSTRKASVNLNYIKAFADLAQPFFNTQVYNSIDILPHFNPDLDLDPESAPQTVIEFRNLLKNADAILICTPEYAMGVPGSLKNALDWTVSSCEFSGKPTALITASSLGEKSHRSLLETLHIIEARINENTQLIISYAKTKISDLIITDPLTLEQVKNVIANLNQSITNNANESIA